MFIFLQKKCLQQKICHLRKYFLFVCVRKLEKTHVREKSIKLLFDLEFVNWKLIVGSSDIK